MKIKKEVANREAKYETTSKGYILKKKRLDSSDQSSYNIPQEFFENLIHEGVIKKNNKISELSEMKKYGKEVYQLSPEYSLNFSDKLIDFIGKDFIKKVDTLLIEAGNVKPQIRYTTFNKLDDIKSVWFEKLYKKNVPGNVMIYEVNIVNKTFFIDIEEKYDIRQPIEIKEEIETNEYTIRKKPLQKILFGAPGTGKSYKLNKELEEIYDPNSEDFNNYIFRITIHPEYTYHDFVGNIMPTVSKISGEENVIEYNFKPGIFTKAYIKAKKNPHKDIYLVLEEMSRGNIVSTFGDLFQVLDRKENGESEYGIKNDLIVEELKNQSDNEINDKTVILPSNFNIMGTINTSDQSVFSIDTAFKRRFEFEYIDTSPVKNEDDEYLNQFEFKLDEYQINWIDLYESINEFIVNDLNMQEDKQVGQFFIKFNNSDDEKNYYKIYTKLLHYLWHDIHQVRFEEKSLFKNDVKTYSKAYNLLKKKKNIFNEDLVKKFLKET